jgi:hypothetical protein
MVYEWQKCFLKQNFPRLGKNAPILLQGTFEGNQSTFFESGPQPNTSSTSSCSILSSVAFPLPIEYTIFQQYE